MKNIFILLLISSIFNMTLIGQNNKVLDTINVDLRVELISIAFRLADAPGYNFNRFPQYIKNIEDYFEKYKEHELIHFIKKNLIREGIAYDAVMYMAINITDSYPFKPLMPFSEGFPEKRWKVNSSNKFLELFNEFYIDTNFEQFFNTNEKLYSHVEQKIKEALFDLNVNWYYNFYNENPETDFKIIIALGNGGANYGVKNLIYKKKTVFGILGTWKTDDSGDPIYDSSEYLPVLLHEFNHSFVNHLVEKYRMDLSNSGKKLFKHHKKVMKSQAYGKWETMIAESIVRACVIIYLLDHKFKTDFIKSELNKEIKSGFIWTTDLIEILKKYNDNRLKYSNFDSFMPEIVNFFVIKAGL